MATCIERKACKDCGSSDSIQTYLNVDDALGIEWYTSFCHGACWEHKGDLYAGTKGPTVYIKTEAELREEVATIRSCKIFAPIRPFRGIPASFYKRWGCRTLLSEFDGKTPYAIGFPMSDYGELTGWKCRPFNKKDFYGVGRSANVDPFGLPRALKLGGDTLWWTEGEFDAIALDYCMTLVGKRNAYPVVSLTHGGGSIAKNFEQVEDRVGKFKYHALVLDDDEVGHLAEETARNMWGNKVIIIKKPKNCKDANEAVLKGSANTMGKLAIDFKK